MDQEAVAQAVAEAEEVSAPSSTTDVMPDGAMTLGDKPAAPIGAAAIRFLDAVREVETEMTAEEETYFLLWCSLNGTKKERRRLWRLARKPVRLYNEFIDWMYEASPAELIRAVQDLTPFLEELNEAGDILPDDGDAGGPAGNVTGSR